MKRLKDHTVASWSSYKMEKTKMLCKITIFIIIEIKIKLIIDCGNHRYCIEVRGEENQSCCVNFNENDKRRHHIQILVSVI